MSSMSALAAYANAPDCVHGGQAMSRAGRLGTQHE